MYKLKDPPQLMPNTTWYGMAEACFQTYFKKHDLFYYHGFLHYYEPILNEIVSGFVLRYAMIGHFADLKQEAVLGLLEAEQHYDPNKGKHFLQYSKVYMKNRMHYYIRKMRRGCTVTTAYADKKLRTVMRKFYDYGGRNDLETICKVAEEMKIPQEEATEIIQRALLNTLCTEMYRPLGSADGEWEESSEERTVSPYPEPYEALQRQYRAEALYAAWNTLNYREKEMLAAHLGFCSDCFGTLERTGDSSAWYDCAPRKRTPTPTLPSTSASPARNRHRESVKRHTRKCALSMNSNVKASGEMAPQRVGLKIRCLKKRGSTKPGTGHDT